MAFELKSTAFENGSSIPTKYTGEGKDVSPPLAWSGVPAGSKSLALIVSDPDAPDPKAPRMTWTHWVLFNLPPSLRGLAEAVQPQALPPETREGHNDWGKLHYGGPMPPIGRHRYFFRLYALDATLDESMRPTREQLEAAMRGHVLATAELMGTYQKQ